jgi:putative ABC transport system permease protein
VTGPARQALAVLMAGTVFVLLILCANLASIVLVRAAGRRKEVALRTALGARTFEIVRPWIVESLILSCAGAALGLPFASVAIAAIKDFGPAGMPRLGSAGLTPSVILFSFGLAFGAALLFGLLPLTGAARLPLAAALREESRGTSGGLVRSRLRSFLVITEVVLATVLLICAGLLVRTLSALHRVDPGFRAAGVLTLRTSLPTSRYGDEAARALYVRRALSAVEAAPGVLSAGAAAALPLTNVNWQAQMEKPGQPGVRETVSYNTISPRYLETLGVPLRQGRWFNESDTLSSPRVFLVSEAFARSYFPGRSPLGQVVRAAIAASEVQGEIVGVVGDLRHLYLHEAPVPFLYQPHGQMPFPFLNFAIRTVSAPDAFAAAAPRVFAGVDSVLPVDRVRPLQSLVDAATSQRRLARALLLGFSLLAALLAALGLYGLLAYSVAQRSREMGVRLALGASAADLRRLILRQGLLLSLFGIAAGIGVTPLATRALSGLLFSTPAGDPVTYFVVGAGLFLTALLACLIPSFRAARTDPAHALRAD